MNRYILDGMLADMRAGKKVLYVGENQTQAHTTFEQVAGGLRTYEKARRTAGEETVESPPTGGRIWFRSVRSGVRGFTAGVLVIDADPTPKQLAELLPAVSHGEVIR